MDVCYHARTDIGRQRSNNQDCYGVGTGEHVDQLGLLLVLCDGVGGYADGALASRMAVDTILSTYYNDDAADRAEMLLEAFTCANISVYAQRRGMLTTAVAALFYRDTLYVANVGDSRAYLIRSAEVRQITRDHSLVEEQLAVGLITLEEARHSPFRNMITRAIGREEDVAVDLFQLPLQIGDTVLLCCDGLYGLVADAKIGHIVSSSPIEMAVEQLIDLANRRGGYDNITVVVARVEAVDKPPECDFGAS